MTSTRAGRIIRTRPAGLGVSHPRVRWCRPGSLLLWRLAGEHAPARPATAIIVPGFARQFAGQGAESLNGRHEVVSKVGWSSDRDDTMASSSIHHRSRALPPTSAAAPPRVPSEAIRLSLSTSFRGSRCNGRGRCRPTACNLESPLSCPAKSHHPPPEPVPPPRRSFSEQPSLPSPHTG